MRSWDWQLINIYNAGIKAFTEGRKRESCPYKWHRVGLGRQRWDNWHKGFDDAVQIASDQRLFDRARNESKNES
jgi:ribosome modulation factor